MATALTFIRVIYDPEGDGEKAVSDVTLVKFDTKSKDNISNSPAHIVRVPLIFVVDPGLYHKILAKVTIYPVRFTALFWRLSQS